MKSIDIIDEFTVRFYKPQWKEEDFFLAECLDIVVSTGKGKEKACEFLAADIRIVCGHALFGFMKQVFPQVITNKSFRDALFLQLRRMYTDVKKNFLDGFDEKADYQRAMFKHQKSAVNLMIPRQYNFLAFEQGLGKTLTSATVSKLSNIRRTIIVCPALVKWNWFEDMTRDWNFNPLYWTILDAKKSKCMPALQERFLVINYEMIEKHWGKLVKSQCGHIILDEAHMIKNHKTKRWGSVKKLVDHFSDARVTLMSGTPITNRVIDLFAYFKLVGHPLGNNFSKFKIDYARTSKPFGGGKILGTKNMDDLKLKMSNFLIRKKTEECIDLPDLNVQKYYFDVGDLDGEYEEVLEEIFLTKEKYDSAEGKEKAKLKIAIDGNIHTLNRITSVAKAKGIAEMVRANWEIGRKTVVFAGYRDALRALEVMFEGNCVKIDGTVDSHKRQSLVNKFKDDDECFLFLGNFKAAGVGINLVNARDVVYMNFPFTHDDMEQPFKRLHRIGQKVSVNVYLTYGRGTIDEHIFTIVAPKSKDISNILDEGKEGVVHYDSLSDTLIDKLIEDYKTMKGIPIEKKTGFVSVK
jgi:SWI/SNF-related matrix-associated actin-dependent regulator 1 of chromatin subfamily A